MASAAPVACCLGALAISVSCSSGSGFIPPQSSHPGCGDDFNPGRLTLRRLNRVEYNNTIRDLLGTSLQAADRFPADGTEDGFDTVAEALTVSPLHVEAYEAAAQELASEAVGVAFGKSLRSKARAAALEFEAERIGSPVGQAEGKAWNLWSNGEIQTTASIADAGRYEFAALAWGTRAGDQLPRMVFRIDGNPVAEFDVDALAAEPADYRAEVEISAGDHQIAVAFVNDFADPNAANANERDRNLLVDRFSLTLVGGSEAPGQPGAGAVPTDSPGLEISCDPDDVGVANCARQILRPFVRRAWRRPAKDSEIDRLVELVLLAGEQGDDFSYGIQLAVQAVLTSPHFLFRVERDPPGASGKPYLLSGPELAARLSYFLWSTMPDAELRALADDGTLAKPAVLQEQVERMLADPRAVALVDGFAEKWLAIDDLAGSAPDPTVFPDFDEDLRAAMREEVRLFFQAFLEGERSMLDMVDAGFTYLNRRLADHYGVEGVSGRDFAEVAVSGGQRGGLLSMGAILTATSTPIRTSPVHRGIWVLDRLLCDRPPPPPPNVAGLPEGMDENMSLRERLAAHRSDPSCAACHESIDPIGLGMENYDPIGAYRTEEVTGVPIDAAGSLPSGQTFQSAAELAQLLKSDPRLPACMVEKMMVYAVGRSLEESDQCIVDDVQANFSRSDYRLSTLIRLVVTSDAFRMRRAE
jgi:hypothetical protein